MNKKNLFCVNKYVLLFLIALLTTVILFKFFIANSPKSKATVSQYSYFSLAAIKTNNIYEYKDKSLYREAINYYSDIISRIGKDGAQLIVMPEYTFFFKDSYISSIIKNDETQEYNIITDESNKFYSEIVDSFKNLAKKYQVNIFLTSFHLYSSTNEENNTGFYINELGKITGYKKKFEPPVGRFYVNFLGEQFKVLPLICGEAFFLNDPNYSNTKTWVKANEPYDILVHAMRQADVNFSYLESYIQIPNFKTKWGRLPISWYIDAYHHYYQPYFDYLSNRPGVIVVSDINNIAGIFNKDLHKFPFYKIGTDFDIAKIKINLPINPGNIVN